MTIFDPNRLERNTYALHRERLEFDKLNRTAVRITHPPGERNDHDWSFSCVTPFNVDAWNSWPTKTSAEKYVAATDWLNGTQGSGLPNLDDAKYVQIILATCEACRF